MAPSSAPTDAEHQLNRIVYYASGANTKIDEAFKASIDAKFSKCNPKGKEFSDSHRQNSILFQGDCPTPKEENKYFAQEKAAGQSEWNFLHNPGHTGNRGKIVTIQEFLGKLQKLKESNDGNLKGISADIDAVIPLLQERVDKKHGNDVLFNLGYDGWSQAINSEVVSSFSQHQ